MSIRVLHVFSPSLRTRFGGQNITWKYNFSKWSNTSIIHQVLENEQNRIISPEEAFNFSYPQKQTRTSSLGRMLWIPTLLRNLRRKGANTTLSTFISCGGEVYLLPAGLNEMASPRYMRASFRMRIHRRVLPRKTREHKTSFAQVIHWYYRHFSFS